MLGMILAQPRRMIVKVKVFQHVEGNYWLEEGECYKFNMTNFEHVATLKPDEGFELFDALEGAFFLTNHMDQPWSQNEGVEAVKLNARSTSVGDVIVVDDAAYVVDRVGFKLIEEVSQ